MFPVSKKYEWQSDFARQYVAIGRGEGWSEGIKAGLEEGRRAGMEKGEYIGAAKMFLIFLNSKGLKPDSEQERRIRSCTDLDTLGIWVERAIKAEGTVTAEDIIV